MSELKGTRRSFLTRATGLAAGGMALFLAPFSKAVGRTSRISKDNRQTYGPVRQATGALSLPLAPDAARLFAPYQHGDIFKNRWAIAHVAHGQRDQIVVVLVDVNSGGHAELEVFASDPNLKAIAESDRYSVILDNGARGNEKTPPHICDLAEALAEMIAKNEQLVDLTWRVPTVRNAPWIKRKHPAANEPYGDMSS